MKELGENPEFKKAFKDFVEKWAPKGSKAEFIEELGEMLILATKEDEDELRERK